MFAQLVAEGFSNTDAYLAAGYKVKTRDAAVANGARLLVNDNVKKRVADLRWVIYQQRREAIKKLAIDKAELLTRENMNWRLCYEAGDRVGMTRSCRLIAEMSGILKGDMDDRVPTVHITVGKDWSP